MISSGKFGTAISVQDRTEFGELASNFNTMSVGLKESYEGLQKEISERIEAEEELMVSEERFRNLVETTSEWIWEVNENAIYTYVSPKVRDILGYEPEEILGKSPFDLMPPEEAGRVSGIFGSIAAARKTFKELESVNIHKDGRPVVLETSGVPFFDADGTFCGYRGVDRDITERKKIHETLQRAEQMKIVGEWAAGLVHEIKNPLAGIKGAVELLIEELPLTEKDKTVMNSTVDEIQRIESLLKSLLNYARPPKPEFHTISINDILDKTVALLFRQPSLSPNNMTIEVLKDFDKNLPETKADPLQLQQIFMNLISNAIESMQNSGILSLRTSFDAGANAILIDISDTGKGIDERVINSIFQPFFTTKPRGTGLGLAITKRLVELHGGRIHAENKKDGGALFHISLPVRHKKEAAEA